MLALLLHKNANGVLYAFAAIIAIFGQVKYLLTGVGLRLHTNASATLFN